MLSAIIIKRCRHYIMNKKLNNVKCESEQWSFWLMIWKTFNRLYAMIMNYRFIILLKVKLLKFNSLSLLIWLMRLFNDNTCTTLQFYSYICELVYLKKIHNATQTLFECLFILSKTSVRCWWVWNESCLSSFSYNNALFSHNS